MSRSSMSLALVLVLAAAAHVQAQTALSAWTPGVATNYGGVSEGADPNSATYGLSSGSCGYGDLSDKSVYPFFSAVGIPPNSDIATFPSGGCGTCLEFECVNDRTPSFAGRCGSSGSTVTVTVTDTCPECASPTDGTGDHFDLNALAYNVLSPMVSGRIDVNYRVVACAPPSSLKVKVDGASGTGLWLRLLITTVADLGTISAVNIQGGGGGWTAMTNTYGAAWEVPNAPALPISLEVTSGSQTVALTNVLTSDSTGTFNTNAQFGVSGSTTTSSSSSSSSSFSSSSSSSSSTSTSTTAATAEATPAATPAASGSATSVATPAASTAGSYPGSTSVATPVATGAAGATLAATAGAGCSDSPPTTKYTCAQHAGWGQCTASWMQGFCGQTCGTC